MGGLTVDWFKLGKRNRSKLAEFLNRNDLTQQDLANESGVSKSTIIRVCQGDNFSPTMRNAQKIIKALKKLTGKKVDYDDFWTM